MVQVRRSVVRDSLRVICVVICACYACVRRLWACLDAPVTIRHVPPPVSSTRGGYDLGRLCELLVANVMLRRCKDEVTIDLPPKHRHKVGGGVGSPGCVGCG